MPTSEQIGTYKLTYSGQEVNELLGMAKYTVQSQNGSAVNLKVTGEMNDDDHAVNVGWVNRKLTNYVSLNGTNDSAPIIGNIKISGRIYDLNDNRAIFLYDLLTYGGYSTKSRHELQTSGLDTNEYNEYHGVFVPKKEFDGQDLTLAMGKPDGKDTLYTVPKYKFVNLAFLPDKLLGEPKKILDAGDQNAYSKTPNYGYGITDVYFAKQADGCGIEADLASPGTNVTNKLSEEIPGTFVRIRLGTTTTNQPIVRDVALAANTIRNYNILKSDTGLTRDDYTTHIVIGGEASDFLNGDALQIDSLADTNPGCIKVTYKGNIYDLQGHGKTLEDFHLSGTYTTTNGIPLGNYAKGTFSQEQLHNIFENLITSDIEFSGTKTFADSVVLKDTLSVDGLVTLKDSITIVKDATVSGKLTANGATTLGSTLQVTGTATFKDNVSVSGTLTAAGKSTLNGGADITGATNINDTLHVSKDATFDTNVDVSGIVNATTFKGSFEGNLIGGADSLSTARQLKVDLSSTAGKSFDGTKDVLDIGVSGTLPISSGGTGKTSFTDYLLHYGKFLEVAMPKSDGAFLRQNSTGAPYFSSVDEIKELIGAADANHTHDTGDINGLQDTLNTINEQISNISSSKLIECTEEDILSMFA